MPDNVKVTKMGSLVIEALISWWDSKTCEHIVHHKIEIGATCYGSDVEKGISSEVFIELLH